MYRKTTYRKIKRRDYRDIEELINKSFGMHHYTESPIVLKYLLKMYLRSSLSESTYGAVAVAGGRVTGVVLGRSDRDYRRRFHGIHLLWKAWYFRLMTLFAKLKREDLKDYKKLIASYRYMIYEAEGDYDGEITLFAAERGSWENGVCEQLYTGLTDYWKRVRTKKVYLYTDSTCLYGFFEKRAFKRKKEMLIWTLREGAIVPMSVYLYECDLERKPEDMTGPWQEAI